MLSSEDEVLEGIAQQLESLIGLCRVVAQHRWLKIDLELLL